MQALKAHAKAVVPVRQNCPRIEVPPGGQISDGSMKHVTVPKYICLVQADRYEVQFEGGRYDSVVQTLPCLPKLY